MGEYLIRYFIFFCVIALFVFISVMARKFPIVGALFSLLRKLLILLITIIFIGVFIFSLSFLACIGIGLAAFFLEENLFVYAGERINPFDTDHSPAVIKLSATYAILYFFAYIACILLYSRVRVHQWFVTALATITATFIVVLIYPMIIHSLFSDLTVSIKGALFLVITIFLTILGHRRKQDEDTNVNTPILNVLSQLIPFLPKRKKSVNNNRPQSF
ncbi:hypothetical protein [Bacillus sp. FJAT-50079]|uniref:hypothetical protein n=1 Tax=Bacillus sp. FJAT-50079 TaxID=2833577 RepID=UPI001BC99968|nr:hypothetical protein [Bacillus sp. FJAT-50079]MBS4208736.1 hypothetical protein [Bacillus sp. FJAT-50079]